MDMFHMQHDSLYIHIFMSDAIYPRYLGFQILCAAKEFFQLLVEQLYNEVPICV